MIDDHFGCLDVDGVLTKPLGQVAVGSAANIEQQILDVIQLVFVSRLVVDVVAQILQIFHSRAACLKGAKEEINQLIIDKSAVCANLINHFSHETVLIKRRHISAKLVEVFVELS